MKGNEVLVMIMNLDLVNIKRKPHSTITEYVLFLNILCKIYKSEYSFQDKAKLKNLKDP